MPVKPIPLPRPHAASASLVLAFVIALLAVCAAPAAAAPPAYKGSSADGEVVFFESEEQLVPGDTDSKRDLYVRAFDASVGDGGAYVTRQISTGPTGGNDAYNALFEKAGADGSAVFFSTDESLVALDTDRRTDVYVRDLDTGTTQLVSRGASACQPSCGNDAFDSGFAGATADAEAVFLVSAERLAPAADSDNSVDVYLRDRVAQKTSLVSAGTTPCLPACGNGEFVATLRGIAADGSLAFFATAESLAAADDDNAIDIYSRALPDGPTIFVSAGDPGCAPCGNSDASAAIFAGASADGGTVFFTTKEGLVPADDDGATDVYQRSGGATTLVSAGTATNPANFAAAPGTGSTVFFVTAESLVVGDSNGANDVYMWQGGPPQLITSGKCCGSTFAAATVDAGTAFFTTTESLAVEDADASADIYAQDVAGSAPTLVSAGDPACSPCGDGAAAARFNRASADGGRVFFTSEESLSPNDFDDDDDIYVRGVDAATTSLSTPASGPCPTSECDATFVDASGDGIHVLFQTTEAMAGAEDGDSEADIYERAYDPGLGGEVTRLVSTGNSAGLELGPDAPELKGTAPGSPGVSTKPAIVGVAEAGSLIKIYRTATCSGEPAATGTAAELAEPGISVTVLAGTTTSFWATAEAEGFTSLCSSPVSYTQASAVEPPPSPSPPTGGGSGGGTGAPPAAGSGTSPVKTHNGIAYVAPLTKITFGPSAKTRFRRPVFRFTDFTGQPGTRFSCRLDRARWKSCGSPTKLPRLGLGRHVFSVKAVNAVGVPAVRPASRTFKLVAQ
ncbi:MAG TPA: hypothetical protein VD761_12355 [Solirubrobacterales bacterium]|nr:hypothetical protein [Solirubrobacterales bacterium]